METEKERGESEGPFNMQLSPLISLEKYIRPDGDMKMPVLSSLSAFGHLMTIPIHAHMS